MKRILLLILGVWGLLALACQPTPSPQSSPNILLICVDDLRPELGSFGVDYIHSPHIDQLAAEGVAFRRHYVNAPSCGPSRYSLLMGRYGPAGNQALFQRAQQMAAGDTSVFPSLPEYFRGQGYTTVSVGKVSHHPGGRGGPDWQDSSQIEMPGAWDRHLMPVGPWQHPRGAMHGLAKGEIRVQAGDMAVYQAVEGEDELYPDGLIAEEALQQLAQLTTQPEQPFLLAVGFIRPHLPFGAPEQYLRHYAETELPAIPHPDAPLTRTTWHASGEFMKYQRWDKDPYQDSAFVEAVRRHYAACVSYADAQIGKVLAALEKSGAAENTIVVLWGDHGWHLGEHAIWGKHSLFEEALRSPLIIRAPGQAKANVQTSAVVESLDLFPTLCELTGQEIPAYAQGTSLLPILQNPRMPGHPAFSYQSEALTLRTDRYRLIHHQDGFNELYDHQSPERETKNIARLQPEVVKELTATLAAKQALRKP
ncbi:MAG: sulfatase [Bacteroidota bacterium]